MNNQNQLRVNNLKIDLVIGIDPDLHKSGLAVWSRSKQKLVYCKSVTFVELLANLDKIAPGAALFRVDAGWLNNGFHHAAGLPDGFNKWTVESKQAYYFKMGTQVGRNFAVGQLICQILVNKHGPDSVFEVQPMPKNPKWSAADLKRYTGWDRPTNPDSRDSAKLCFQF